MALHSLVADGLSAARDLWLPASGESSEVERISARDLTQETFVRDFVSRNKPVVITDALTKWPALYKWNPRSFFSHRDEAVTVNFTPDGWGDALIEVIDTAAEGEEAEYHASHVFAKPQEVDMPLGVAAALIAGDSGRTSAASLDFPDGVPYLSWQNDSLRRQTPALLADLRPFPFVPWGAVHRDLDASMGAEAVNLWLGDERSTSSIHKDHFENLYAVVRGEKVFTLLPPCDVLWLYERQYATGVFRYGDCASGVHTGTGAADTAKAHASRGDSAPTGSVGDGDDGLGWRIQLDLEVTEPAVPPLGGDAASAVESPGDASHAYTAVGTPSTISAEIVRVGCHHLKPSSACSATAAATVPRAWRWLFRPAPMVRSDGAAVVAGSVTLGGHTPLTHVLRRCAQVPWISVNPSLPRAALERRFPLYTRYAAPTTVRVKAGETLYLPSLWYHQVTQSELTLAVNHWWDMDYCGPGWAYYNMCRSMAPAVQASFAKE